MGVRRIDLDLSYGASSKYDIFLDIYFDFQANPAKTYFGRYSGQGRRAIIQIVNETKRLVKLESYFDVSQVGVKEDDIVRLPDGFKKSLLDRLEVKMSKLNIGVLK